MWNRHRESEIHDIHEINSGTKLYYLWVKGYSTWGERDTIFLCGLLLHRQLSTQPTRSTRSVQIRLASPRSESWLCRLEAGTQLTAFSKIPKSSAHAYGVWRHSHPLVSIPIWDFYLNISEWHILSMHVWTPALMLHLTNPCAKQKVLSLTKPKGKIYKMKSLRNYITELHLGFELWLLIPVPAMITVTLRVPIDQSWRSNSTLYNKVRVIVIWRPCDTDHRNWFWPIHTFQQCANI